MGAKAVKLSYSDMAVQAVLKTRVYKKGVSRQAIKKYIETEYKKVVANSALRAALKKLVAAGTLSQDGQRFKLDPEKKKALLKPPPKPKKKKKKPVKKKTKKKKKKKTKKKKPKKKKTKKKTKKKKTKATKKKAKKKAT